MIDRGEKRAVAVLCAAVLATFGIFTVFRLTGKQDAQVQVQQVADQGEAETQAHMVGERFELVGTDAGFGTYRASLGWKGAMEVAIEGAQVWKQATSPELSEKLASYPVKILEGSSYLELEVTLDNVSASTTISPGRSNHPSWFNITSIRICDESGTQNGTPVYFTGTPEDAAGGEDFYFELPVGQSATYTIGYLVEKPAVGNPEDLSNYVVHLGNNDQYGSCTVSLGGA